MCVLMHTHNNNSSCVPHSAVATLYTLFLLHFSFNTKNQPRIKPNLHRLLLYEYRYWYYIGQCARVHMDVCVGAIANDSYSVDV